MNDLHNFDNAEILAAERLAIEAAVIIAELKSRRVRCGRYRIIQQ